MINCVGWNLSRAQGDGGVGGKAQGVYFIILFFFLLLSHLFYQVYGRNLLGEFFIYFPCLVFLYLSQKYYLVY